MAQSVSVLDGEVNRNWHLIDKKKQKHILTLFHDCVTGARAAMLDYQEVPGSAGTTNLFNLVSGRVGIPFVIAETGDSGQLSILRRGLTGFSYECEMNGRLVLDTTSIVQNTDYEYEVSMPATVDIGSRVSGVTWYEVHSTRKVDGKGTLVHRRFRDFYALHEQVESLMKGHHLRSSLPRFPGKKSKLWTNHGDMSFVEDRRKSLEQYMKTLLQLPHVSTLDSTRAFLGMVGNLREFSVAWDGKELGGKLKRASEVAGGKLPGASTAAGEGGGPPVITSVLGQGRTPPGVCVGDRLFKVNGESTEFMSLEAAWSSVQRASRPVLLHFLGPIIRMDATLAPLPEAFLRRRGAEQKTGSPPLAGDGDRGGPLRPNGGPGGGGGGLGGANNTPVGAAAESQWQLRGLSQMNWPAWRKDQAPAEGAGASTHATDQRRTGSGKPGDGKAPPPGRAVGPFGNGAGAAPGGLPASSRLFGDVQGAERTGGERSADAWRPAAGAKPAGLLRPVRPSGGDHGGGKSSKGASDWMPVMAIGSKPASSNAPSAAWWGLPSQPGGSAGGPAPPAKSPPPDLFPAGNGMGSSAGAAGLPAASAAGAAFGSAGTAWPPERPKEAPGKEQGVPIFGQNTIITNSTDRGGAGGIGGLASGGQRTGSFSAAPLSRFADVGGGAGGPVGGAFGAAVSVDDEGDGGEEEGENPFA